VQDQKGGMGKEEKLQEENGNVKKKKKNKTL